MVSTMPPKPRACTMRSCSPLRYFRPRPGPSLIRGKEPEHSRLIPTCLHAMAWQDHIQRQCDTLHRLVPHARAEPELAKPPATADFALAIETLAAARDSLSEELHGAVDEQVQWAIASTHASRAALAAAAELFAPTEVRRRFELERIKHSWLIMHCETLLCKLALLDVQFKAETYSQQKVKALRVIAEIAQAGLADARRARSDVRRTLDGYSLPSAALSTGTHSRRHAAASALGGRARLRSACANQREVLSVLLAATRPLVRASTRSSSSIGRCSRSCTISNGRSARCCANDEACIRMRVLRTPANSLAAALSEKLMSRRSSGAAEEAVLSDRLHRRMFAEAEALSS